MGEKTRKRKAETDYLRLLDETDPFDQLIMELGQGGTLDIHTTPIEQRNYTDETAVMLPLRGKHTT
jgi:hypothetical protein